MIRALLGDSSRYLFVSVSARALAFASVLIQLKYLSLSDFGILATLSLTIVVVSTLALCGLPFWIFRNPDDESVGRALSFSILSSLKLSIFLLLGLMAGSQWGLYSYPVGGTILFATLGNIPILVVQEIFKARLKSQRRINELGISLLTGVTLNLIVTWFLLARFNLGIGAVVVGGIVGDFASLALMAYFSPVRLRALGLTWVTSTLQYSAPFILHFVEGSGLILLLQGLLSLGGFNQELGVLSLAVKFSLPLMLVLKALTDTWIPMKFGLASRAVSEKLYVETYKSVLNIGFLAWFILSLIVPAICYLFLKEKGAEIARGIPITSLVLLGHFIFLVVGSKFELFGRTAPILIFQLVGFVAVCASSFWFDSIAEPEIVGLATAAAVLFAINAFMLLIRPWSGQPSWAWILGYMFLLITCGGLNVFIWL